MIVISYAEDDDAELADGWTPAVVHVDTANRQITEELAKQLAGERRYVEVARRTSNGLDVAPMARAARPARPRLRRRRPVGRGAGRRRSACGSACSPRPSSTGHHPLGPGRRGRRARRRDPDSTDLHLADTLAAGDGLCDVDAVRVLVDEGPDRVHELIALGAVFDRRRRRRARLGPARAATPWPASSTPAAPPPAWRSSGPSSPPCAQTAAAVLERTFALDLVVEGGRCGGVHAPSTTTAPTLEVRAATCCSPPAAPASSSPSPPTRVEATGDGIAMALRAGVAVADVEFVQFHPTALHHPPMPRPLLSEALRGHGALLRDTERRAVRRRAAAPRQGRAGPSPRACSSSDVEHVWLDATGLEDFAVRFPTIAAVLAEVGLDPATDWLPVAPAAHYCCGGVVTDLDGATSLPGLWAAGEVGLQRRAWAPTGWRRTRCSTAWCSRPGPSRPSTRGVDGPAPTGAMRAVLDGDDVPAGVIGGRRIDAAARRRRRRRADRPRRAAARR